jgi:ABC-2 type transport system ATP-binding protein
MNGVTNSGPVAELSAPRHGDDVISVRGLVKRYGDVEAVNGIDLDVHHGEIFGFLGPNGAGKSTTISMLCTLAEVTAGTATVAGHDVVTEPDAVRGRIGLVFQDPSLDDQLTARENLMFHARVYGVPRALRRQRIDSCLETVGLAERAEARVRTFSGGMKRRLEVARGLLHAPEVLFLDEPTQGLDPQTRARVWQHLRAVRAGGATTIFMTTHYMEEAEWCDRIAIIDHGRIVAIGTPEQLEAQVGGDVVVLSTDDSARAVEEVRQHFGVEALQDNGTLRIEVPDGAEFVPRLIRAVSVTVKTVTVRRPSLDDVFLKLTGRAIRDESADGRAQLRMFAQRWGGGRR